MEPHYSKPMAQLPEYANREQDLIRQAFQAGNFTYLANLPTQIQPSSVSASIKEKCKESLERTRSKSQTSRLWGCPGQVYDFEWLPDDYNASAEKKRRDRAESETKRMLISATDFIPSSSARKGKYEEGFSKTSPGYVSVNDDYNEDTLQSPPFNWLREGYSNRVFKPTLHDKGVAELHPGHFPEIISHLTARIREDWEEVNVLVTVNPEELVEVRFEEATVDNSKGLHTYMNIMINKDPRFTEWQLKRVGQNWGFVEDGFIYYQLAPPWKALNTSDAFYMLNASPRTSLPNEGHKPRKPRIYSYHTGGWSPFITNLCIRLSFGRSYLHFMGFCCF